MQSCSAIRCLRKLVEGSNCEQFVCVHRSTIPRRKQARRSRALLSMASTLKGLKLIIQINKRIVKFILILIFL